MTRHQVDNKIPWVMPWVNAATGERVDTEVPGGGYGYGLFIYSHRVIGFRSMVCSPQCRPLATSVTAAAISGLTLSANWLACTSACHPGCTGTLDL